MFWVVFTIGCIIIAVQGFYNNYLQARLSYELKHGGGQAKPGGNGRAETIGHGGQMWIAEVNNGRGKGKEITIMADDESTAVEALIKAGYGPGAIRSLNQA